MTEPKKGAKRREDSRASRLKSSHRGGQEGGKDRESKIVLSEEGCR